MQFYSSGCELKKCAMQGFAGSVVLVQLIVLENSFMLHKEVTLIFHGDLKFLWKISIFLKILLKDKRYTEKNWIICSLSHMVISWVNLIEKEESHFAVLMRCSNCVWSHNVLSSMHRWGGKNQSKLSLPSLQCAYFVFLLITCSLYFWNNIKNT